MGHQFGFFLAAIGWLVRGRPTAGALFTGLIIAARLSAERAMAR
ncbi:MAG: hypothetical protein R2706_16750 [Acidimicrobiales bacterium]